MKRKKTSEIPKKIPIETPTISSQNIPWASATAMRMLFDYKLEKFTDKVRFVLDDVETIQTQIAIDEVLAGIDAIRQKFKGYSEESFLLEFNSSFATKWWTEMLPED